MLGPPRRRFLVPAGFITIFLLVGLQFSWNNPSTWNKLREHTTSIFQPSTSKPLPELQLSDDYYQISEDQLKCDLFYGEGYLKYIAAHQHQYCNKDSRSSLQCFRAQRLQGPWESDPLCIARGVHMSPTHDTSSGRQPNSMHCQLRNFTQEAQMSESAAERYRGVQNVADMGVYFFDTGAGKQFEEWEFSTGELGPECSSSLADDSQWILLARREGNVNLWHKLMEIWQAMLTIDAIRISRDPQTNLPYLNETAIQNMQVVFEDDRAEPLDGWWTAVTGNPPLRRSNLEAGCYGNVIIPLAGSSSPFWTFLLEARQHETCRTSFLMDGFLRRIFRHLGLDPRKETDIHADPVVTIIDRKETRQFVDLQKMVAMLRELYPRATFNVIDFATISLLEQVKLVQSTDVLVGHHGAGMTHVLFLPPGAAVVEIFPPVFSTLGFRHVARMRQLDHFVVHCIWPEEWNATVNGVPLPDGWVRPNTEDGWQQREWTYMAPDEFVGSVDAAIRSQLNKAPNRI